MTDDDARLDALLAQHQVEPPSASLMRAVAEIPLRHPRSQWGVLTAWLPLRRLAMGGVLALSLGACAGYASAALDEDATSVEFESIEADYAPTLDLLDEEGT